MLNAKLSRRKLIEGLLLSGAAGLMMLKTRVSQALSKKTVSDIPPREPDFSYEINRSDEEWKSRLSSHEYQILREGGTEKPKSSPLWEEQERGDYRCKGCELLLYASEDKIVLNKGWVFFTKAETDSVLNGIDQNADYGARVLKNVIEAHCRRCGSHLGHVLYINRQILHCINGASLTFEKSDDPSRKRSTSEINSGGRR